MVKTPIPLSFYVGRTQQQKIRGLSPSDRPHLPCRWCSPVFFRRREKRICFLPYYATRSVSPAPPCRTARLGYGERLRQLDPFSTKPYTFSTQAAEVRCSQPLITASNPPPPYLRLLRPPLQLGVQRAPQRIFHVVRIEPVRGHGQLAEQPAFILLDKHRGHGLTLQPRWELSLRRSSRLT